MSCKSNVDGVYEHIKNGQNAMFYFPTEMKSNPVVPLQTNPPGSSRFVGKIRFPVRGLNDAVPRLIGLVLRRGPDRLVPEVLSGI